MNGLLNNGWIQSIVGALIASAFTVIGKWLFARNDSYLQAIFSVSVATIVFSFGTILQPAVQYLTEGNNLYWIVMTALRRQAPGAFVLGMLAFGAIAGIPTGLAVLKGKSFNKRVAYGSIWAPIFLVSTK